MTTTEVCTQRVTAVLDAHSAPAHSAKPNRHNIFSTRDPESRNPSAARPLPHPGDQRSPPYGDTVSGRQTKAQAAELPELASSPCPSRSHVYWSE